MWLFGPFRGGLEPRNRYLELTDTWNSIFLVQKSIVRQILVFSGLSWSSWSSSDKAVSVVLLAFYKLINLNS